MRTTILGALAILSVGAQPLALSPANMPRIGAVDQRFQSYNIEMVEVTGGRFWKPYDGQPVGNPSAPRPAASTGIAADLYEYRPPIDLTNARLRRLTAALGPAYTSGSAAPGRTRSTSMIPTILRRGIRPRASMES